MVLKNKFGKKQHKKSDFIRDKIYNNENLRNDNYNNYMKVNSTKKSSRFNLKIKPRKTETNDHVFGKNGVNEL